MGSRLPIITGLIWLYVLWRFVWPLPWPGASRVLLALLLFFIAQTHWVTGNFFGTLASPELPQPVLIALAWLFGVFLLLAMLLFVRDLLALLLYLPWRAASKALVGGGARLHLLAAAALVLATLGVWQAVKLPGVKNLELRIPNLPAAFDGYHLVQLTDTHASRLLPRYWQAGVVERANALKPDLIVITGDLADGDVSARAADVQPLQDLHAPDGVVSIPGNHEYYSDYRSWMAALRALGLHMLENQHLLITRGADTLAIAGLTDPQAAAFGLPAPDLQAAIAGIPPGASIILLDHRPASAPANSQAGVALQLSGHTHGGQILGAHWLTQIANNGFVAGLYELAGGMQLYVSNGTGLWNGLALRLGRPSEITNIILKSGN